MNTDLSKLTTDRMAVLALQDIFADREQVLNYSTGCDGSVVLDEEQSTLSHFLSKWSSKESVDFLAFLLADAD